LTGAVFLGIDVGTSGAKVIAADADGSVVGSASAGYPSRKIAPGWIEQDPADWWLAVCRSVRQVVERLPSGGRDVAGVGLSGHMSSLVVLDPEGAPLRPCITISDGRGGKEASWLVARLGSRIKHLTGTLPSTSDLAPKLLWLKANEPEVYARMSVFVAAKDYVRLLLTGRLATEPTDAGNSLFLDVRHRRWDVDLVNEMGLDPATLPPLVGTTEVVGGVTPSAAVETGLVSGTPVVAGGADMATSSVGTAAVAPGVVAVTIGMSAQVTTAVRAPHPGAHGRLSFHPHAVPDLLYAMGSILGGGITLRWLAGALGEESELTQLGERYFDRLSRWAATSPAGSGGAVFLPFLVGSGSPDFDPEARASYVGLSLQTGRAQLVRAALEGVAYNVRESVDVLRELEMPAERFHLAGGGAASSVWCKILASVLDVALHPTRVRDASALGAAALAAVGVGAFGDVRAAAEAMVLTGAPILPEAAARETYRQGYETYVRGRVALREVFRRGADDPRTDSLGTPVPSVGEERGR
jgi:xylulokinase